MLHLKLYRTTKTRLFTVYKYKNPVLENFSHTVVHEVGEKETSSYALIRAKTSIDRPRLINNLIISLGPSWYMPFRPAVSIGP